MKRRLLLLELRLERIKHVGNFSFEFVECFDDKLPILKRYNSGVWRCLGCKSLILVRYQRDGAGLNRVVVPRCPLSHEA